MGVIIHSFNSHISPNMSQGVLACDTVVTELHTYNVVIKDFVRKSRHYLCRIPYLYALFGDSWGGLSASFLVSGFPCL